MNSFAPIYPPEKFSVFPRGTSTLPFSINMLSFGFGLVTPRA
jgi:hypothetical protein